jgi:hypothetical protein
MAKVTEKFTSRILNQMLLESMKNLNMVKDALDPAEQKVIAQINEVTKLIAQIEV